MIDQQRHLFTQHLPHICQACKTKHETWYSASTCCLRVVKDEPQYPAKGDRCGMCKRFTPWGRECRGHFITGTPEPHVLATLALAPRN